MKSYEFCFMSPWCEEGRCCCESYDKELGLLSKNEPTPEELAEIEDDELYSVPDEDIDTILAEELGIKEIDEDLDEPVWQFDM